MKLRDSELTFVYDTERHRKLQIDEFLDRKTSTSNTKPWIFTAHENSDKTVQRNGKTRSVITV